MLTSETAEAVARSLEQAKELNQASALCIRMAYQVAALDRENQRLKEQVAQLTARLNGGR